MDGTMSRLHQAQFLCIILAFISMIIAYAPRFRRHPLVQRLALALGNVLFGINAGLAFSKYF